MVEEDGCYWCVRWNKEIFYIYLKMVEGRIVLLRWYDLYSEIFDVIFEKKVCFILIFILVCDGVEVGWIEGYFGEDFFWSLFIMMFIRVNVLFDEIG